MNETLDASRRAVEIDPDDSMSHTSLGYAHVVRREPDLAIPPLERAIENDPNNYLAPRMLGIALISAGEAHRAIPHLQRALELSRRDPRRCE